MSDVLAYPVLAARAARLSLRTVDALFTALLLPVMIMLLFVYLFGGAIQTGDTPYVVYALPGVLVLCTAYGASMTAPAVTSDMTAGIIDRFRSMDVGGRALLAGHITAGAVRNLASVVLVVGAALLIGFRGDGGALGWLAALGVLIAFIVALSALSAAVGLLARSVEAAGGFTFAVLFLPYPSSAFVPVETMPGWLRGFAEHQPCTPVIEAVRALLTGAPAGSAPWIALTWCGGIFTASLALGSWLFHRRTR
ncbi:ABC transporter permease [Actinomadura flavalba]|uniref:ABC transporter permease n=1 Tax=Actinomadura flavalba TaxID=1120938 RepID=UPI000368A3D0|nr:ABC transporter permease [Actinomadura flavalba]